MGDVPHPIPLDDRFVVRFVYGDVATVQQRAPAPAGGYQRGDREPTKAGEVGDQQQRVVRKTPRRGHQGCSEGKAPRYDNLIIICIYINTCMRTERLMLRCGLTIR